MPGLREEVSELGRQDEVPEPGRREEVPVSGWREEAPDSGRLEVPEYGRREVPDSRSTPFKNPWYNSRLGWPMSRDPGVGFSQGRR